jgi:O-acetyl-ADP-ribose deacetylase (regulator of RNase III)
MMRNDRCRLALAKNSPSMSVVVEKGDLLAAPQEVIAQQCCCTAVRPHGLSSSIAAALGTDFYRRRRPAAGQRNCAVPEDRPAPGTCEALPVPGRPGQFVAALYGQYAMGKPGRYFADHNVPDGLGDREEYFARALEALATWMKQRALRTVAFPCKIGCGLAGGSWPAYKAMLDTWAARHPEIAATIYEL